MIKDNEQIYDEQIAPLMTKIIEICKEHEIPMLCTFQYGPEDEDEGTVPYCTTVLGEFEGTDEGILNALNGLNKKPSMMAVITTSKD